MLNKTSQTNTDLQWQKNVAPIKPAAPVAPTVPVGNHQAQPDITRFIESANVAAGLLYTEALRQAKEERTADTTTPMPHDQQHARSLADLPYLIKQEYAAYRKQDASSTPSSPSNTAASSKSKPQAKRSTRLDSTGVWVAAIAVALCVVVVKWLF